MQDLFDLITALLDWPTFPSKPRRKRVFSTGFVALAVCVAVVELVLLNVWTGNIS